MRGSNPSPKLDVLSLHENAINDDGVRAIADAIRAATFCVTKLTLWANKAISSDGRAPLLAVCDGAEFDAPEHAHGSTPYIKHNHTPQRWLTSDEMRDV